MATDPSDPYFTDSTNDDPAPIADAIEPTEEIVLGADASFDEVRKLTVPEQERWLETYHSGMSWVEAFAAEPSQTTEPDEDAEPEGLEGLEGFDQSQLERFLQEAIPRIADKEAAEEIKATLTGTSGSFPDGSPQRLAQLQRAATAAVNAARIEERPFAPDMFTTRYDAARGGWATVETESISGRERETAFRTSGEIDEALEGLAEADGFGDPAKVTLADVSSWGVDRWARFDKEHPEHADRLRRGESEAMTEAALQTRRNAGIF